MATTYEAIAKTVLATSTATVTLSSIPTTFRDLILVMSARTDAAGNTNATIRFNGDTTTNYSWVRIIGDGSTPSANSASSQTSAYFTYPSTNANTTDTFGNAELYISNYTSTDPRQMSNTGVAENNGTLAYMSGNAILYRGTSAITSIAIATSGGSSYLTGSSFYLYGIKNS